MRNPLTYAASIAALVVAGAVWIVGAEAANTLRHVGLAADSLAAAPALLAARVAALQASIDCLPKQILPPVLARVDVATGKADAQLTGMRADVQRVVDTADMRLWSLQGTVQSAVGIADKRLASIQDDARPVLVNTAALVKDTQDSLDDSYWTAKALIESATYATTQVAYTAESVRTIAPQFLATAQETNQHFAGIAGDVHVFTAKFTGPTTVKSKIWEGFKTMTLIGARIL